MVVGDARSGMDPDPVEASGDFSSEEVEKGILSLSNNNELSCMYQNLVSIPEWLIEKYGKKIQRLDLSHNKINTLRGLEEYKSSLKELILDNNEIVDETEFPHISSLETLFLNHNQITDTASLCTKLASCFPNLSYLSLIGNPACPTHIGNTDRDIEDEDYSRYRLLVVYVLPSLKFLDWEVVTQRERLLAQKQGAHYSRVAKPREDHMVEEGEDATSLLSPLPPSSAELGSHSGTYKRNQYTYIGKHSEGNRFITNQDL